MSGFEAHPARAGIIAWLGDVYTTGELDNLQLDRFAAAWGRLDQIWPDSDDQDERNAALSAALRYISGDADERDIGHELRVARAGLAEATAAARMVATLAVEDGATEVYLARDLGIDRSNTLRRWLGK